MPEPMTDDRARAAVLAAVTEVAPDAPVEDLRGDDDLLDVLELDSMDLLNIAVAVHRHTGIEIPERDYPKLVTLDGFAAYLVSASG